MFWDFLEKKDISEGLQRFPRMEVCQEAREEPFSANPQGWPLEWSDRIE